MRFKSHCTRLSVIAAFFAFFSGTLCATSIRPVDLNGLVTGSGRIFHGICVGSREAEFTAGPFPAITYTFEVIEGVKGATAGEITVFRQLGHGTIAGLPQYEVGREYVVFLNPDSDVGLTSPVGLKQGSFEVIVESGLETIVRNGVDNLNLRDPELFSTDLPMGRGRFQVDGAQQPVSLDALLRVARNRVESLQRLGVRR